MKRILSILAIIGIMVAMLPAAALINVPTSTMYVKTANGKPLNLREEPDLHARIVVKIPYGTEVKVYTDFVGMVWYHVQYGLFTGYVKAGFLVARKPKPFVTPTPRPTVKPTVTPMPSEGELISREIAAARSLGLVPQGMKTEGNCTWQELDALLTNAIQLKTRDFTAYRKHVYLSLTEYRNSRAGAEYDIVLRGVAAAEMFGALIDIGGDDPRQGHFDDPYIADAADISFCQAYAGIDAAPGDWRTLPMLNMVMTIVAHVDSTSGKSVMALTTDHEFFPNHPLTRTEAILGAYRLTNAFSHALGMVTVTHQRQANLRAGPSMQAAIVGKVDPGDMYPVVEFPGQGWYKIMLPNGTMAYIAAGMVAFEMR